MHVWGMSSSTWTW